MTIIEYEAPELTASTAAINAVSETAKGVHPPVESQDFNDTPVTGAYQDWE
jgi:hypothetical protein